MARSFRERIDEDPISSALYRALLDRLRTLDGVDVEERAAAIHAVHGRIFLGVRPRSAGLLLTIVLDRPIDSARMHRVDQVSTHRWHNTVLLAGPDDLDAAFESWVAEAYALTG
jgi:Domain of unknown function (DUF5655)